MMIISEELGGRAGVMIVRGAIVLNVMAVAPTKTKDINIFSRGISV